MIDQNLEYVVLITIQWLFLKPIGLSFFKSLIYKILQIGSQKLQMIIAYDANILNDFSNPIGAETVFNLMLQTLANGHAAKFNFATKLANFQLHKLKLETNHSP